MYMVANDHCTLYSVGGGDLFNTSSTDEGSILFHMTINTCYREQRSMCVLSLKVIKYAHSCSMASSMLQHALLPPTETQI